MKKIRMIISVIIVGVLLIGNSLCENILGNASVEKVLNNNEDLLNKKIEKYTEDTEYSSAKYTLETWYDEDGSYPVSQDDKEWSNFRTHQEMIDACTVPDELLSQMTTEELLNLLYNYPLLIDMYSYDSVEEGMLCLASECNIIKELYKRNDFSYELLVDKKEIGNADTYDEYKEKNVIDTLLNSDELDESSNEGVNEFEMVTAMAANSVNLKELIRTDTLSIGNGKTTKGAVYKYAGSDWSSEQNAEYRKTYPLATFVSKADNRYNCHSYAWYSQSSSNTHWIFSANDFINSGLYKKIDSPKSDCKIEYIKNGNIIHSGILIDKNKMTVKSKWGTGPVMIHSYNYSPYCGTESYKYYIKK